MHPVEPATLPRSNVALGATASHPSTARPSARPRATLEEGRVGGVLAAAAGVEHREEHDCQGRDERPRAGARPERGPVSAPGSIVPPQAPGVYCGRDYSRRTAGEDHDRRAPEEATLLAFLLLVVVAGGNAPAIRFVSCEACELEPFWAAALRFLAASALFAGVAAALRLEVPRGRAFLGAALFGVLQFGVGFGLVYWGLVRAPAGLGQVLLACVPLLTFGLALAHRQERFRWAGIAGAVLALAGIAVVFESGLGADVPLASMLALLGGAVCWAEALVVVKGFPPVAPAALNAVAMAVGGVVLLAAARIAGEAYALPESASTWGAQAYLVLAGSLGVFWLYVLVVRGWTASAASYHLVLVPLVTVLVSAWLHDERVTPAFAAGSALVLAGVYVGALRRPGRAEVTPVAGRETP